MTNDTRRHRTTLKDAIDKCADFTANKNNRHKTEKRVPVKKPLLFINWPASSHGRCIALVSVVVFFLLKSFCRCPLYCIR